MKLLGLTGIGGSLLGCDLPSTVNLEEGKENIVSYLLPGEDSVPGLGTWYASVCLQCTAGCGIHGRVREGRPLKIEGNPDSPINAGKSCQMGQAVLQAHYNPDRITRPLLRKNGKLVATDWETALQLIKQNTMSESETDGDRIAWFTGSISGHQHALLNNYLEAIKSPHHYAYEAVNTEVLNTVNQQMFGDAMPELRLDKSSLILSFGADFLGTWISPVHFAGQFSQFRSSPERGTLIQIESKMSLTGANADLWVAARPGSEGILALAIANSLLSDKKQLITTALPQDVIELLKKYDINYAAEVTGISDKTIVRITNAIATRMANDKSCLALAGAPVEGQEQGFASVAAIQLLNIIMGSIGNTIKASPTFPFPQLTAKNGSTYDLLAFSDAVKQNRFDVVFFLAANPVFNAPQELKLKENLQTNVRLKIALAQFPDETVMQSDLVLPLASSLEDWGTHVASYQPAGSIIGFQQPLMERMSDDVHGIGDLLLDLLKMVSPGKYSAFDDYYAYLRNAVASVKDETASKTSSFDDYWDETLSSGQIALKAITKKLNITLPKEDISIKLEDDEYPLHLLPSPRMGLYDGRHANLPWLQESPDQISKVVWDSWAEIHPETAEALTVNHGDIIKISSRSGTIEVKAYLTNAIHKDAIAVPLGQGHTEYGRYARGIGVNPLTILDIKKEKKTGELAMYATRVKIEKTTGSGTIVRLGATDFQHGRQFVRTVSSNGDSRKTSHKTRNIDKKEG